MRDPLGAEIPRPDRAGQFGTVPANDVDMLIRSTPYACFVMLRNGLTLEIVYDRALIGESERCATETATAHASDDRTDRDTSDLPGLDSGATSASCGVWLMGESVLTEVVAGQA